MNAIDPAAVRKRAVLLYGPQEIDEALARMAAAIEAELAGTLPVVLCILTGGIIPTGHLLTRLNLPLEIDYLHASRYRGATTGSEQIDWVCRSQIPLQGRTVLVIDDILDEGNTLDAVYDYCRRAGAAGIYSAVLIEKRHARRLPGIHADFTGLQVDDRYVFGFGMDYHGYMRNLNGIYALADEQE